MRWHTLRSLLAVYNLAARLRQYLSGPHTFPSSSALRARVQARGGAKHTPMQEVLPSGGGTAF